MTNIETGVKHKTKELKCVQIYINIDRMTESLLDTQTSRHTGKQTD